MAAYENGFEGIASGTAVTTLNSGGTSGRAFDQVIGSVVAQSAAAQVGTMGVRASLASSTESAVAWNASGTDYYVRGYFRVPAGGPTHNMRLIYGVTGTTHNWQIRFNIPNDHLDLMVGSSQRINLSTTTLAASTWYRVEAHLSATAAELRLYAADGTLLESGTWTGAITLGTQVRFGLYHGTAVTSSIDADGFGWSDTDWLGAQAATVPTRENGLDALSDGTAVTTGNSGGTSGVAFDAVSGTVAAATSAAWTGSVGLLASLSASTQSYVSWNVTGTTHYLRAYYRAPAGGPPPGSRPDHEAGTRTPPVLVGHAVLLCRHPSSAVRSHRRPPIPLTGSAREAGPRPRDLFHEPEAHPKTGTAEAPPEVTVRDRRPSPGGTLVDTSLQRGEDAMASALVPGDLVIHPHDSRAVATVIQVVGDFVAIKDDFGTVVTNAGDFCWSSRGLLALTANRRVRVGVAF